MCHQIAHQRYLTVRWTYINISVIVDMEFLTTAQLWVEGPVFTNTTVNGNNDLNRAVHLTCSINEMVLLLILVWQYGAILLTLSHGVRSSDVLAALTGRHVHSTLHLETKSWLKLPRWFLPDKLLYIRRS